MRVISPFSDVVTLMSKHEFCQSTSPIRFEKRGRDMAVIAIGVPESDTLNLVKVTFFVDSTATV